MDKDHMERIVRALATFRPSFIALIMNLTEEDLIFMEKCFQRTILVCILLLFMNTKLLYDCATYIPDIFFCVFNFFFMKKEFEKLISFSGTPTVVWRRTGEIALVGKEFSLLTQWSKDQLLGKTTYIYEVNLTLDNII